MAGVTYVLGSAPELELKPNGTWQLDLSDAIPLSDGTYDIVAVSTDSAGNSAGDGTSAELIVDRAAPRAPTVFIHIAMTRRSRCCVALLPAAKPCA